jgi:hypothetical protein
MIYTIDLEKSDTECLRQTVSEAYNTGKDWQQATDDQTKLNMGDYYVRLLNQIEHQAERIARRAFQVGQAAPQIRS